MRISRANSNDHLNPHTQIDQACHLIKTETKNPASLDPGGASENQLMTVADTLPIS